MTTEQQSELEEIKQLISDRFDKQDQKISDRFDKQDQKINQIRIEIVKVESKLGQDIAGIKVDVTWIKWLFGGLLSFILILLSAIITSNSHFKNSQRKKLRDENSFANNFREQKPLIKIRVN